jgi:hypothetical protein
MCRDTLEVYGSLMRYQPEPTANAYCYDGPLAARQFGPNPDDVAEVLDAYPWLETYGAESCRGHVRSDEKWPGHAS